MDRKVILYISMSLDGYIATKDNSLAFLSIVEKAGEDYGYYNFINNVDAVIIGRKTYDKVIELVNDYPHHDKEVYIITRTAQAPIRNLIYYTDSVAQLVENLKSKTGKNIYCDGGAEIANELIKNDLVDEYIISVLPILLGEGIRLFNDGRPEQRLKLIEAKMFEAGLTQLHYAREKN